MRLTTRGRIVLAIPVAVAGLLLGDILTTPDIPAAPASSGPLVAYEDLPDTLPAYTLEEALENCKVYGDLGYSREQMACEDAARRTDW